MPDGDPFEFTEKDAFMGELAGPLALKLALRCHGKPQNAVGKVHSEDDYPFFIHNILNMMEECLPAVAEAMNRLGRCVSKSDVETAMQGLEVVIAPVLDFMDTIKSSNFIGIKEVKPLLLNAIGRPVQDVIVALQTISTAVSHPYIVSDEVIPDMELKIRVKLDIEEEMDALKSWITRQNDHENELDEARSQVGDTVVVNRGFGWGSLLGAFALGWWVGDDE